MSKVKLTFGYRDYLVDVAEALTVIDILDRAERVEIKWDQNSGKSYFVYSETPEEKVCSLDLMPDDLYRMAKLAGRPTK
jgi:hypothetical protein